MHTQTTDAKSSRRQITLSLTSQRSPLGLAGQLLAAALMLASTAIAQVEEEVQMLPPIGSTPAPVPGELPPPAGIAPPEIGQFEPSVDAYAPWWSPPTGWFTSPVWEFGAELGLNGSAGNAQAFSVLAAANGKRETDGSTFTWDIKYGKTQTAGLETQHFALGNSRWDWNQSPRSFLYLKNSLEYDEFKAFDLRLALSSGFGYHFVKNDFTTFTGRLGAGTSREFGGPDDDWVPEANLGIDFEHKLSDRQRVKLVSDYYPSWEDFQDYRLVTDAFWELLIDGDGNLSLKIGAVDRYDSTPNGLKHNDIDYFVTLIWKN